jgi:hypothetical protein
MARKARSASPYVEGASYEVGYGKPPKDTQFSLVNPAIEREGQRGRAT